MFRSIDGFSVCTPCDDARVKLAGSFECINTTITVQHRPSDLRTPQHQYNVRPLNTQYYVFNGVFTFFYMSLIVK